MGPEIVQHGRVVIDEQQDIATVRGCTGVPNPASTAVRPGGMCHRGRMGY
jgi:hypothetical protein